MWYIRLESQERNGYRCWVITPEAITGLMSVEEFENLLDELDELEMDWDMIADPRLLGLFWGLGDKKDMEDAEYFYELSKENNRLKNFDYIKQKDFWSDIANLSQKTPINQPQSYIKKIYTYCISW